MRQLRGVGAGSPERKWTLRRRSGKSTQGLRSSRALLGLLFVVASVAALYTTLSISGERRSTSSVAARAAGQPGSEGGSKLRSNFGQLNVTGVDEDNGLSEEWRTCRAYEESGLPPHKKVNSCGGYTKQRSFFNLEALTPSVSICF